MSLVIFKGTFKSSPYTEIKNKILYKYGIYNILCLFYIALVELTCINRYNAYFISGKVRDVKMFANYVNLRNSGTFPTAYFLTSGKTQFYLSTNFSNLRTFPYAKCLEMQIRQRFDTHFYL